MRLSARGKVSFCTLVLRRKIFGLKVFDDDDRGRLVDVELVFGKRDADLLLGHERQQQIQIGGVAVQTR